MKKQMDGRTGRDVVFRPALTPLEAAVLPAREKRALGALSMIKSAYDATEQRCGADDASPRQRAKIWVR